MTVQDVDCVPARDEVQGYGQDLGDPVGEELVRRCEKPGLSGKKRYGLVDWEGYFLLKHHLPPIFKIR